MEPILVGVIGGSGLYDMDVISDVEEIDVDTPFGPTSDKIITGSINGVRVAFVSRHGRGHLIPPSQVPYRANVYALKSLGVRYCIAVSACGSLQESIAPGHIVVPDQLFDFTKGERDRSFFDTGLVGHISVAQPFCDMLRYLIIENTIMAGGVVHEGGSFITIEGPRFSTKIESQVFRSWGMSIIGMTTSPEAFLAREAEISYAVMAHVTDYDVWHESEKPVTVDMVVETMQGSVSLAQEVITDCVSTLNKTLPPSEAHNTLKDAIMTAPESLSAAMKKKLGPIIERYV